MNASSTWALFIKEEQQKAYFQKTQQFVEQERKSGKPIYPLEKDVFSAFSSTAYEDVRVVILGQDPYHGPNQAHGLSFSVLPGIKIPPSLRNIYKELTQDIEGFETPSHGYLQSWAEQGVLLLNTVLTVEEGKAHSHAKSGWEQFTDSVIEKLNQRESPVIFLLWGAHAQKKGAAIDSNRHIVFSSPHPSPLSARRGFFGCRHFSKVNEALMAQGLNPIHWHLPLEVDN